MTALPFDWKLAARWTYANAGIWILAWAVIVLGTTATIIVQTPIFAAAWRGEINQTVDPDTLDLESVEALPIATQRTLAVAIVTLFAATSGALVGGITWFVVRRVLSIDLPPWILASTLGWVIGLGVVIALNFTADAAARSPVFDFLIFGMLGGAVVGLAQWPLLRGQVERSWFWVLTNAAALGSGWAVANMATLVMQGAPLIALLASGIVGGIAFGLISGIGLAWLIRQPRRVDA
ncbi:MAG: hypothetical protein GYB68_16420 [Chloroflexi bacterium]|nr:hypothetical protein [Chloroflexota bacterium]